MWWSEDGERCSLLGLAWRPVSPLSLQAFKVSRPTGTFFPSFPALLLCGQADIVEIYRANVDSSPRR